MVSNEYELILANPQAKKDLKKYKKSGHQLLLKKLQELLKAPRKVGRPLKGELEGLWRVKVPPFRIIYKILEEEKLIALVRIETRDDAYDDLEGI